jgi:hypothetical protein
MMIDDQDIHTIFNFEVSVSKIKLIVHTKNETISRHLGETGTGIVR